VRTVPSGVRGQGQLKERVAQLLRLTVSKAAKLLPGEGCDGNEFIKLNSKCGQA
jgi:hypothetical protein